MIMQNLEIINNYLLDKYGPSCKLSWFQYTKEGSKHIFGAYCDKKDGDISYSYENRNISKMSVIEFEQYIINKIQNKKS